MGLATVGTQYIRTFPVKRIKDLQITDEDTIDKDSQMFQPSFSPLVQRCPRRLPFNNGRPDVSISLFPCQATAGTGYT